MNAIVRASDQAPQTANILCIDQFANWGGGQRSLLDILPAFSKQGWRSFVAVPGEGPFPEILRKRGYNTLSFNCGNYASKKKPFWQLLNYAIEMPHLGGSLSELIDANKAHLLYVNGPRLVPPVAWLAWRKGIPLVFHCHNRLLQRSAIALTGQALELASARVIACCEYAADPLRDYVAPGRLHILYNGVGDTSAYGLQSSPEKIRRIGVVGRIEVEKGQLEFVRAARLVLEQVPDCRFSVIGSPMFSGFEYYRNVVASSQGLPIEFVEWQSDVSRIYSDLDLLVVPSGTVEATTRVILEAYSAGVPVVAFPAGGIPEILEDEETGFLSKAATVEALAGRMLSVLSMNRANVRAVVKRARKEWRRRFTLSAYQDAVCGVLVKALQPGFQECTDVLLSHSLRRNSDAIQKR